MLSNILVMNNINKLKMKSVSPAPTDMPFILSSLITVIIRWKTSPIKKITNCSTSHPKVPYSRPSRSFKKKNSTNSNLTNTSRIWRSIGLQLNLKINSDKNLSRLHINTSECPMLRNITNLSNLYTPLRFSLTVAPWFDNVFLI